MSCARDHGHLGGAGQLAQHGFDLAELDPEAAHLDLVVAATGELQHTVGTPTGQVTGAVEPRAGPAVRVGDEPGRGQPGPAGVPLGQARSADVQLAGHAVGHRRERRVEHVQGHVVEPVAGAPAVAVGVPAVGVHGGLGRPVQVVRGHAGDRGDLPPQVGRGGLAADQQHPRPGRRRGQQALADELPQVGGGDVEVVQLARGEIADHRVGVPVAVVVQHVQLVPVEEPEQRLPRTVENERRHVRDAQRSAGLRARRLHQRAAVRAEQVRQAAVGDQHALGLPRRPGRVEHIRRRLRGQPPAVQMRPQGSHLDRSGLAAACAGRRGVGTPGRRSSRSAPGQCR